MTPRSVLVFCGRVFIRMSRDLASSSRRFLFRPTSCHQPQITYFRASRSPPVAISASRPYYNATSMYNPYFTTARSPWSPSKATCRSTRCSSFHHPSHETHHACGTRKATSKDKTRSISGKHVREKYCSAEGVARHEAVRSFTG